MRLSYIKGDIIHLALSGGYDVVGHGCNCFCTQKRGLAVEMAHYFNTDNPEMFQYEAAHLKGNRYKLGCIEATPYKIKSGMVFPITSEIYIHPPYMNLNVVNMYTQYHWKYPGPDGIPLDYDALRSCMQNLGKEFKGQRILLPKIGAGLAGGDWERIIRIIGESLEECIVTIVDYNPRHKINETI